MQHALILASLFLAMVCAPAAVTMKVNRSIEQDLDGE